MQVTCQPGEATRKNYSASLNVSIKYAREVEDETNDMAPDANSYFNPSKKSVYKIKGGQPSVIAVLPLVDSQNVALGNSSFEQMEIALQLSAAFSAKGLAGAANVMNDFANQHQSEVNTRNSVPVVTSYTDGSTFGFKIYPSLMAQTEPGNAKSRPGNLLQPITFPAVVAILIDKSDLGQEKKHQRLSWDLAN
jgi:hypothetical protein